MTTPGTAPRCCHEPMQPRSVATQDGTRMAWLECVRCGQRTQAQSVWAIQADRPARPRAAEAVSC